MTREPIVEPLTQARFRKFGDVIERNSGSSFTTNDGEVLRHHDLTNIDVTSENGRALINIFQVLKPASLPVHLRLMERHPISTQTFVPMNPCKYLVVVAEKDTVPTQDNLRVFMASEGQGISLHVGVWHHPLIAFDASDFLVIDRTAIGEEFDQDYEEVLLEGERIWVTA